MVSNYLSKVLSIIFIFLSAMFVLFLRFNPANIYEISVCKDSLIVCFVLLYISGMIIFSTDRKKSGLFIAIYVVVSYILLPYMRGYFIYGRGDLLTHLGIISDILKGYKLGADNLYPAMHIYLATIVKLTGLDILKIVRFAGAFMFILNATIAFIICNNLMRENHSRYLSLIIATIPFMPSWSTMLIPQSFSILLYLLFFLFVIKRFKTDNSLIWSILLIITLAVACYTHPLTAAFILIISFTGGWVLRKGKHKTGFIITLLGLVIYLAWLMSRGPFFEWSINWLADWIINDFKGSSSINVLQEAVDYGYDIIKAGLKNYGQILLLYIFSIFSSIWIYRKKNIHNNFLLLSYLIINLIALVFIITGTLDLNIYRVLLYPYLILVIFFWYFLLCTGKSNHGKLLTMLILPLMFFISIKTYYPSPYNYQPNQQLTYAEYSAHKWLFNNKNSKVEIGSVGSETYRMAHLILGYQSTKNRLDISINNRIEDHFLFSDDIFFVVSDYDKALYNIVFKKVGRFTYEDFNRINDNSNVLNIYNNYSNVFYYHNISRGV